MKLTRFTAVLVIILIFSSISAFAMSGDGSENNPFVITSGQDLKEFSDLVNAGNCDVYAALENDISISEYAPWQSISISQDRAFEGVFDGNGHRISGYNCYGDEINGGLFGFNKGLIKNIVLEGEGKCGICYQNEDNGKITGCINYAEITAQDTYCSGIAVNNGGEIISCKNHAKITAGIRTIKQEETILGYSQRSAAGICANNGGKITDCVNYGEIYAQGVVLEEGQYFRTEALFGICNDGEVMGCVNRGNITAHDSACGISHGGTIERCINYGTIETLTKSETNAGGISVQAGKITDCINYGDVINNGTANYSTTGGITAVGAKITGCINYGNVLGYLRVGGVSGDDGEIYGSYYLEGTLIGPAEESRPEGYTVYGAEHEKPEWYIKAAENAYIMNTAGGRKNVGVWAAGGEYATEENKAVYKVIVKADGEEKACYTSPDGTVRELKEVLVYRRDNGDYIWTDTVVTEDMTVEGKDLWVENISITNKYGYEYIESGEMNAKIEFVPGDTERKILAALAEYESCKLVEIDSACEDISGRDVKIVELKVDVQPVWVSTGDNPSDGYQTLEYANLKLLVFDENLKPLIEPMTMIGW